MSMERSAWAAIVAHLVVSSVHAAAHFALGVLPPFGEAAFITAVFYAAPLVAALLLWRGLGRAAMGVLAASMLVALAFETHHHFLVVSSDHVAHLPPGGGRVLFQITAVLGAPIDAFGAFIGIRALLMRRS